MTQERFEEIRDTYTMENYTMLSDQEYAEFSAMSNSSDLQKMLIRWKHIRPNDDARIDNRPLRTIIGRNG